MSNRDGVDLAAVLEALEAAGAVREEVRAVASQLELINDRSKRTERRVERLSEVLIEGPEPGGVSMVARMQMLEEHVGRLEEAVRRETEVCAGARRAVERAREADERQVRAARWRAAAMVIAAGISASAAVVAALVARGA